MIILNFTHPLDRRHVAQVEAAIGDIVDQVIELPVQFDKGQAFHPQLKHLMSQLPLSTAALRTKAVLINLPSFAPIAALVLAELHGRMGYFPPILRFRPAESSTLPQFELAEIVDLQTVRDMARRH